MYCYSDLFLTVTSTVVEISNSCLLFMKVIVDVELDWNKKFESNTIRFKYSLDLGKSDGFGFVIHHMPNNE